MPIKTLSDIEQWFNIPSLNKQHLENALKRQTEEPNDEFNNNRINQLQSLIDNTCEPIERIKRALSIVEWKAVLIKYDLINNNTDVLVYYNKKQEIPEW